MGCKTCVTGDCSAKGIDPHGIELEQFDYVIALAGNPNTGKSTVFNRLTGLRQHTGNWPGKTVTRAEGTVIHAGKRIKLVDLPGTYSLLSSSTDEEIARNFVLFGRPAATIVVMDSTSVERNLNLALQILEITDRVVIAANLMDEAKRKGIDVDVRRLEEELGVPVVATTARTGRGLDELMDKAVRVASGEIETSPRRHAYSPDTEKQLSRLVPALENLLPGLQNLRWVALRLLSGDERIQRALASGELAAMAGLVFESEQAASLQLAEVSS